jgi:hypothetical protein
VGGVGRRAETVSDQSKTPGKAIEVHPRHLVGDLNIDNPTAYGTEPQIAGVIFANRHDCQGLSPRGIVFTGARAHKAIGGGIVDAESASVGSYPEAAFGIYGESERNAGGQGMWIAGVIPVPLYGISVIAIQAVRVCYPDIAMLVPDNVASDRIRGKAVCLCKLLEVEYG